jgi:hypothetical protein
MIENFNLEHWPIVYFKSENKEKNIDNDNDNFEQYKEFYLNLLIKCKRNKEQMIVICDLMDIISTNNNVPMKYIMKHVKFNKEIYKFNKEYVKGVCILCNNKNIKNILNIYFGMVKPATIIKVFRSYSKANIFIKDILKINFDINIYNKKNIEEINEEESDEIINNKLSNELKEELNIIENENENDKEKYSELI